MKKIISLFKRDYEGDRLVYDEVVPGAEWVLHGEGRATVKYDGTCCLVKHGKLFKRYDRKLTKVARRKKKDAQAWAVEDFKPAPEGWVAAEPEPNLHTGHWPGWLPIGAGPEDTWHRHAWFGPGTQPSVLADIREEGTYELVGPKVQSNPYGLDMHVLWRHGDRGVYLARSPSSLYVARFPLTFQLVETTLRAMPVDEGIVWHHPDGRMVKIKRRDFGLQWPPEKP